MTGLLKLLVAILAASVMMESVSAQSSLVFFLRNYSFSSQTRPFLLPEPPTPPSPVVPLPTEPSPVPLPPAQPTPVPRPPAQPTPVPLPPAQPTPVPLPPAQPTPVPLPPAQPTPVPQPPAQPSPANPPTGEMVLYQHSFEGRSLSINSSIPILSSDWNNQVTSVLVVSGEWQLCEDSNYQGTCITLTAGAYDWVPAQGLANDALSSVRLLGETRAEAGGEQVEPGQVVNTPNLSRGQWGDVIKFPLIPVASSTRPDGKVVVWSAAGASGFCFKCANKKGTTLYSEFDPVTGSVSGMQSSNTGHDMFCPGISMLGDGSFVVVGGTHSSATSRFARGLNRFVAAGKMNIGRGYASSVTLSNGKVFTVGGSWALDENMDKTAELYDRASDTWTVLTGVPMRPMLNDDPEPNRRDYYSHLHAWTDGSVFHAGPSSDMFWINTDGGGATVNVGRRGATALNGISVMYSAGKILNFGGGPAFSRSLSARTGTELITLGATGTPPTVMVLQNVIRPRCYSIGVVLPTGHVMHFGGLPVSKEFSDNGAIRQPEIWDPATEQWTLVPAEHAVPRTYHSSGVLLPDGRVFIGGGGMCGNCPENHADAEIFSPFYLFDESTPVLANGVLASRPLVTVSPTVVGTGDTILVTASEALSMVSIVRMGGQTHSTNTDQRRLELCGPSSSPCGATAPANNVTLVIPEAGQAIPGFWMVFGMNGAGVPSVAPRIQIQ